MKHYQKVFLPLSTRVMSIIFCFAPLSLKLKQIHVLCHCFFIRILPDCIKVKREALALLPFKENNTSSNIFAVFFSPPKTNGYEKSKPTKVFFTVLS